jgi:hydroxymethylpyrimidine/phosphomethylpyrimidine kinase
MDSHPSIGVPCVLAFSGHDPTGGAGLAADTLALASMGCHPMGVVTAVTVQDSHGVRSYFSLDPQWVEDQARTILEDIPVAAFKVGMLGAPGIAAVVAEIVADYPHIPLVLDPILASGRGDDLSGPRMVDALLEYLVPQATVITPNVIELMRLTDDDDEDEMDPPTQQLSDDDDFAMRAGRLLSAGAEFVLVTGTHARTRDVVNRLYHESGLVRSDTWQRLPGSFHGSGCTLASALAAALARDVDMAEAVQDAQEFTYQALKAAFRPGMGQHFPDRLFWAKGDEEGDADEDNGTAEGK